MGGIGIYGVISVCLFFIVFAGTLLWAFQLKKTFLDTMGSLPLEENETQTVEVCAVKKGDDRHE
jgi:hypothetical protein